MPAKTVRLLGGLQDDRIVVIQRVIQIEGDRFDRLQPTIKMHQDFPRLARGCAASPPSPDVESRDGYKFASWRGWRGLKFLHRAQIAARLQHMRGEGVAQLVRMHMTAYALLDAPLGEALLHVAHRNTLTLFRDEQRVAFRRVDIA